MSPAARKPRAAAKKRVVKPAGPVTFLTDKQKGASGLDRELADCEAVYGWVERAPHATRDDLTRWAVHAWADENPGPVDRLNVAIGNLIAAGRLHSIDPAG